MARFLNHVSLTGALTPGMVVGDRVVDWPGHQNGNASEGASHRCGRSAMRCMLDRHQAEGSLFALAERLAGSARPQDTPLELTRRCAPIPDPGKIIGVGLNYRSHAAEADRELPEYPMLFAKFANTVAGPEDSIRIPRVTHRIDYEGELAVVIGRAGRYIPESEALGHVAGYMVANDVSARDYQVRTREMLSGKTFDGFAPMGPYLVTPDEVGDVAELTLRTWVNGELRQSAAVGDMIFSVARLIAYASEIMTLDPGDIILTGTPAGIGATLDPRRWLRAGDEVIVEIDRIGSICNRVEAESAD